MERQGDVGLLQLSNPPQNYLDNPEFIKPERLRDFVQSGIKALVIAGSGRHFSAGADPEIIQKQIRDANRFSEQLLQGNHLLKYLQNLNIPVIAAISGVCFGAGLEIALSCHIRLAEENALFAFPEVNHELFPGLGGTRLLAELSGKTTALELVLEGDLIDAAKALDLRIVDRLTGKKQSLPEAIKLAEKMTAGRPLEVIRAVMQSVKNRSEDREKQIRQDVDAFVKLALQMAEKQEGER